MIRFERAVLILLAIVFCGVAYRLNGQNRELRSTIHEAGNALRGERLLRVGVPLERLRGITSSGTLQEVDLSDGQHLVITLTRACLAVNRNVAAWQKVIERLAANDVQILWVSRESHAEVADYVSANGFSGLALGDVPYDVYLQLGLAIVPQTIVVQGGMVTMTFAGEIDVDAIVTKLQTEGKGPG